MKLIKFLIALSIILFFQSCTKSVDFDQIDDAEIQASYILTQVYFNLGSSGLLDDASRTAGMCCTPLKPLVF